MPEFAEDLSSPSFSSELALRVLRLEQQLDSYQRLHATELEDLRRALTEVKEEVLALAVAHGASGSASDGAQEQNRHSGR